MQVQCEKQNILCIYESVHVSNHLFISLPLEIQSKGWFNPATFLWLSKSRTWIPNNKCHTFCWYWWNRWPSLF